MEFDIIPRTLVIAGKVEFEKQLNVYGTIHGNVISKNGTLIVERSGLVTGDVEVFVKNMVVDGLVDASHIKATETIRVTKNGIIEGSKITFHTLEIEEGAVLENCRLDHKPWPRCGRDANMGGVFEIPATGS